MNTKPISTLWKAIIAVALVAFAGIQANAETLPVEYVDSDGRDHRILVPKDGRILSLGVLGPIKSLRLPEGLTKLSHLYLPTIEGELKLPKDIGKENSYWDNQVWIYGEGKNLYRSLAIHHEMRSFKLNDVTIPSAREILGKIPRDTIRRETSKTGCVKVYIRRNEGTDLVVSICGFPPQSPPRLTKKEGGIEISWDRGTLQSAPTINGPWTDVTFDENVRRIFLRTALPAEFFRVKP